MVAPSPASASKFLSVPPGAVRGFLFYGSDGLQISARADALVRSLAKKIGPDAEIIRLHDTDASAAPDRIAVELATTSLFGGAKILWLTSCPAKAQAAIFDAVVRPIDGAYLIVQAPDLKKSHKLAQAFETAAFLAAIACYGEDRDSLVSSIRQHVSSSGLEIDADAAQLIAARCDFSALLARGEAEKLMTYAGASGRIALHDVEDCLIDQQTAELSEIVDAALGGEGRKALVAFDRYLATEQNVTPIFMALSAALLRLHAVRTAVDNGAHVMEAIKGLRPPVFFKQQDALATQARFWSAPALMALFAQFNGVVKETRLRAVLAEDLTANFLLVIARGARANRSA